MRREKRMRTDDELKENISDINKQSKDASNALIYYNLHYKQIEKMYEINNDYKKGLETKNKLLMIKNEKIKKLDEQLKIKCATITQLNDENNNNIIQLNKYCTKINGLEILKKTFQDFDIPTELNGIEISTTRFENLDREHTKILNEYSQDLLEIEKEINELTKMDKDYVDDVDDVDNVDNVDESI